jgi:hypothetical protein
MNDDKKTKALINPADNLNNNTVARMPQKIQKGATPWQPIFL